MISLRAWRNDIARPTTQGNQWWTQVIIGASLSSVFLSIIILSLGEREKEGKENDFVAKIRKWQFRFHHRKDMTEKYLKNPRIFQQGIKYKLCCVTIFKFHTLINCLTFFCLTNMPGYYNLKLVWTLTPPCTSYHIICIWNFLI